MTRAELERQQADLIKQIEAELIKLAAIADRRKK